MHKGTFIEPSKSFFVDPAFKAGLEQLGLNSIESMFSISSAKELAKDNLARHRKRLQLELKSPPTSVFIKLYDRPGWMTQLRNWLAAGERISCAGIEVSAAEQLSALGINTPWTVAFGEQWGPLLEKRSFIITQQLDAEALERRLPDCVTRPPETAMMRKDFILCLAAFIRKFHATGFRHRDLYLSHIFRSDAGDFYLIDLARAFRPLLAAGRYQVKDIAQLHYSAPAKYFSRTDRLRFYMAYAGRDHLSVDDREFIGRVVRRAARMARHDAKHGRSVPFQTR